MKNLKNPGEKVTYPKDFSPEDFMADSIGTATFPSGAAKPKNVIILVWAKYNFYLKHTPLHQSQRMLNDCPEDGYTIFSYQQFTPLMTSIRKSAGMATSWEVLYPTMSR